MSQTLIARQRWSQPRHVGNNSQAFLAIRYCEKEQCVAGEGGHVKVGQHFSRTNVFVLAPGNKNSASTGMGLRSQYRL